MKSLEQFGKDRTKCDGRMSHCRDCTNAARKARYYANADHEHERNRQYYRGHREEKLAAARAWQAANLEKVRTYWRERERVRARQHRPRRQAQRSRNGHGGPDEWARMWEAQNGCCYLCRVAFLPDDRVHVDHDHDCCYSAKNDTSCSACRRGLAHDACNLLIGIAKDDPGLMLVITVNFERASEAAKTRIAARAATQGALFGEGVAATRIRSRGRVHDGPAEWARMWRAQAGQCYLCARPMDCTGNIHVDHDHSCCPGGERTDSCPACRRGLCHAACNWLIGMVGEDMDLLRLIVDSFVPVQAAARERIAAKAEQGTLDIAV